MVVVILTPWIGELQTHSGALSPCTCIIIINTYYDYELLLIDVYYTHNNTRSIINKSKCTGTIDIHAGSKVESSQTFTLVQIQHSFRTSVFIKYLIHRCYCAEDLHSRVFILGASAKQTRLEIILPRAIDSLVVNYPWRPRKTLDDKNLLIVLILPNVPRSILGERKP